MKAKIHVTLKNGVLDPQGKAVGHALRSLGFNEFGEVRQGKYIEIDIDTTDEKMKAYLEGSVKQITLIFSNEEFERTLSRMEKAGQELKAESNTEVLLKLLDFYETH